MMKLADMLGLESSGLNLVGSSPTVYSASFLVIFIVLIL